MLQEDRWDGDDGWMGVRPALLRWHQRRGWVCRLSSCSVAGQPSWLDVEPAALETSVAVMAPALTEPAGPQKPENLIPALPAGGFLTADQAKQVCLSPSVHPSKASNANHKSKVRIFLIHLTHSHTFLYFERFWTKVSKTTFFAFV